MLCPRERRSAATVELSTPPDIATAMRGAGMDGYPSQFPGADLQCFDESFGLLERVEPARGNAQRRPGVRARKADGLQYVGRLGSAAGAGGPARNGVTAQIERDE